MHNLVLSHLLLWWRCHITLRSVISWTKLSFTWDRVLAGPIGCSRLSPAAIVECSWHFSFFFKCKDLKSFENSEIFKTIASAKLWWLQRISKSKVFASFCILQDLKKFRNFGIFKVLACKEEDHLSSIHQRKNERFSLSPSPTRQRKNASCNTRRSRPFQIWCDGFHKRIIQRRRPRPF